MERVRIAMTIVTNEMEIIRKRAQPYRSQASTELNEKLGGKVVKAASGRWHR